MLARSDTAEDSLSKSSRQLSFPVNLQEPSVLLLITEDKILQKKLCKLMSNVLKATRASLSSSPKRTASSRREKSLIPLLTSLSLLRPRSKTVPSTLLKSPRDHLRKSRKRLEKNKRISRPSQSFVN